MEALEKTKGDFILDKIDKSSSEITFINPSTGISVKLFSEHLSDCCENHYLWFRGLEEDEFKDCLFNFDKDGNFFEKVDGYGIRLLPKNDQPISIPGYGTNNGYYSCNLTLKLIFMDTNGSVFQIWTYDIWKCQSIDWV